MEKCKKFLRILGFYFIVYACMFVMHYATDTFVPLLRPSTYGASNIILGRYSCQVIYGLAIRLGINYERIFCLLILLMIFAFTFFTLVVMDLFKRCENEAIKMVISLSTFIILINPFVQEWFAFWECSFQWSGALIFMAMSLKVWGKSLKNKLISSILLIISLGFYQAVLPVFLILGCTIIFFDYNGRLTKAGFIESVDIWIVGFICSIINYLSIKFFQLIGFAETTTRTDSLSFNGIVNNIIKLIETIPELFIKTCDVYPRGLLSTFCLILLLLSIVSIIYSKEMILNKLVYMVLLVATSVLAVIIPHVMTTTIWLAQRTIIGLWTVVFSLVIIAIVYCKNIVKIVESIVIIMLSVNVVMIQSVEADLVCTNAQDRNEAFIIQEKIYQYEMNSGYKVRYVGTLSDEAITWHRYDGEYSYCDLNLSAHAVEWSRLNYLNYYNGTKYEPTNVPDSVKEKYKGYNSDYLNVDEQLIFDKDSLYIIEY